MGMGCLSLGSGRMQMQVNGGAGTLSRRRDIGRHQDEISGAAKKSACGFLGADTDEK